MSNDTTGIYQTIESTEADIELIATLSDKELAKNLNLLYTQIELAEQMDNATSLELLEVWHRQIIKACIYKAENNISDTPNVIELAGIDIETFLNTTKEHQKN